jgi:MFS family permease
MPLRRNVAVMAIGGTVATSANSLWIMFMPFLFEDMGLAPRAVVSLFSLFVAARAIPSLFGGRTADRIGRKRTLLMGYGVYATGPLAILVAFLLMRSSLSAALLIAIAGYAWMMMGLGFSRPASSMLLIESSPQERKGLSYMVASRVLPSIPAIVLIYVGNALYWTEFFWVALLIGFLCLLSLVISYGLLLRESLSQERRPAHREFKQGFSVGGVFLLLVIVAFALDGLSSSGLSYYVPLYVRPINNDLYASMVAAATLIIAISALASGYVVDKIGTKSTIAVGWSLLALTVAVFPFYTDITTIIILYSIWSGLDMMDTSVPALIFEENCPMETRATVMGTFSASVSLLSIAGPALVSITLLFGDTIPFFMKAVMNLAGIGFFVLALRHIRTAKEPEELLADNEVFQ